MKRFAISYPVGWEDTVPQALDFLEYLKDPKGKNSGHFPRQMIPLEILGSITNEDDFEDDEVRVRLHSFIKKLLEKEKRSWLLFLKKISQTKEVQFYFPDFKEISPFAGSSLVFFKQGPEGCKHNFIDEELKMNRLLHHARMKTGSEGVIIQPSHDAPIVEILG